MYLKTSEDVINVLVHFNSKTVLLACLDGKLSTDQPSPDSNRELLFCMAYKVVSESSRTVIVVTASMKEVERGGQGHTSASLCGEHALFLHECFLNFVFHFVCDG
jgi:hypothetical protein